MGVLYFIEKRGREAVFDLDKAGTRMPEILDVIPREFGPLPPAEEVVHVLDRWDESDVRRWYTRLVKWAAGADVRLVPENDDNICWPTEGSIFDNEYSPDGEYIGDPNYQ